MSSNPFTVSGLTVGTPYAAGYVQVRAFNEAGVGPWFDAPTFETTSAPVFEEYRLASGYYVPRKKDMVVVCPRPMAELTQYSRYLWAHPQMEYVVPIGVQFGAWPFFYELVAAPAGATIGSQLAYNLTTQEMTIPDDYGVIRWTPSIDQQSGTFSFHVRVYDQDYGRSVNPSQPIDIHWDVTVDTSRFVFVAASGSQGDGTISSPWVGASHWYSQDTVGKISVFRGGNYGDLNTSYNLRQSVRSMGVIGFPGEDPVFERLRFDTGGSGSVSDLFVSNITLDGAYLDPTNTTNWHFLLWNYWERMTIFGNRFKNLPPGNTGGQDNPSSVFTPKSGSDSTPETFRRYLTIIRNVGTGYGPRNPNTDNGPAMYITYQQRNMLAELNTIANDNSNGGTYMWHIKGVHIDVTVRREYAVHGITSSRGMAVTAPIVGSYTDANVEVCYCIQARGIRCRTGTNDPQVQNLWFYRNTELSTTFDITAGNYRNWQWRFNTFRHRRIWPPFLKIRRRWIIADNSFMRKNLLGDRAYGHAKRGRWTRIACKCSATITSQQGE